MRQRIRCAALLVLLAVFAAACGDDGSSGSSADPSDGAVQGTDAPNVGEPQPGGSITIGQYTPLTGLDPTIAITSGCCGGIELVAIYDTLLTYDPDTGEYSPNVAESFEPNDDYSVWTLKLPADLKFGDGTPYDAEAVKLNIERHMESPRSIIRAVIVAQVDSMNVVDPQTLEITLKKGWPGFPYVLAGGGGMIASPTAIAMGESFNTTPADAGIGPFKVETFRPGEVVVLKPNPYYHGDQPPYLDEVRFTYVPGGEAQFEAVKADTLDAALMVNEVPIRARAIEEGYTVIDVPSPAGGVMMMNSGKVPCRGGAPAPTCDGRPDGTIVELDVPTKDIRVRKAIVAAINPEVFNERRWDGKGDPHSSLLPDDFPWNPGIDGPKYDPDEAKRLVEEAKADGWDGKLRFLAPNVPAGRNTATAFATMMEAVGIEVVVDTSKDSGALTLQVIVQRDYDVATGGFGWDDVFDRFYAALPSTWGSAEYRYGYGSPEMDAAIDKFRVAITDEDRVDAFKDLVTVYNRDLPAAIYGSTHSTMVTDDDIHGFTRGVDVLFRLDKVWKERG